MVYIVQLNEYYYSVYDVLTGEFSFFYRINFPILFFHRTDRFYNTKLYFMKWDVMEAVMYHYREERIPVIGAKNEVNPRWHVPGDNDSHSFGRVYIFRYPASPSASFRFSLMIPTTLSLALHLHFIDRI